MTQDGNDLEASEWRSVKEDLILLVSDGISSQALASCQELEYSIRRELGLPDVLEPGARIRLLEEVLSAVVAEQRQQAFDRRLEDTFRSAAGWPANQVAATGELLGLTDDGQWQQLRDLRCRQYGETWEALRAKAGTTGPLAERRLRAMLWIGFSSVKTVERAQAGLVHALESAIREYARRNRAALVALAAGEPSRSPTPPTASRAPSEGLEPLDRTPRELRGKHRGSVWATVAAAAFGIAIIASVIVLRGDDPSLGLGPEPSIATPAITRSPPSLTPSPTPAPSQPTRSGPRGIMRLEQLPRCHRLSVGSPLAKRLRAKGQVIVDVRCVADSSVRIVARSGPGRRYRELARLRTGQIIDDVCLRYRGQESSNAAGVSSRVWVGYRMANPKRHAFTSTLWVQGENGAPRCTANRQND